MEAPVKPPSYVAFDTETLGLKVRRPENMLQFSFVFESLDPANDTRHTPVDQLPSLTRIVDPGEFLDKAEIQAVVMNTWIFQEILVARKGQPTKYPVIPLSLVSAEITRWVNSLYPAPKYREPREKPFLVGQNVGTFDACFLPEELLGLFHYRMLEIGSAFYDPARGPLSLSEAKKAEGLDPTIAHDAYKEAMDYILLLRRRHGGNLTPY